MHRDNVILHLHQETMFPKDLRPWETCETTNEGYKTRWSNLQILEEVEYQRFELELPAKYPKKGDLKLGGYVIHCRETLLLFQKSTGVIHQSRFTIRYDKKTDRLIIDPK